MQRNPHIPYVIVLAVAAVVWTWPLAVHFRSHIPGMSGDNYSFLWNLWWMRHVLAHPGGGFFHSAYLFFPFGVDLVNHPHTALQGLISATLLAKMSIVEAENLYIIVSVFLNAAAAYALAYDLTRKPRLALLAGVAFGGSPYVAAHLLGHFDLLTAWVIPLFALLFRRAALNGSRHAAIGAGLCMAVAAYSVYYYVVYLALFAVTYTLATVGTPEKGAVPLLQEKGVRPLFRRESQAAFTIRLVAIGAISIDFFVMVWIWITGGTTVRIAGVDVSMHGLQNPLLVMWGLLLVWALARWKVRVRWRPPSADQFWRGIHALTIAAAVFVVAALPLVVQAFRLAISGRYVSQVYFWRSAPRGVDVTSFVTGNPFHPIVGDMVGRLYAVFHLNPIEQVGWLGVVPIGVLLFARGAWLDEAEARRWKIVLGVFLTWAMGPFLMIAGRDVGLPLPETLARFIPLVENARVPGRAMVGVYLALGVLMALRLSAARPFKKVPGTFFEWGLIALLAFDYLGAPMPLTAVGPAIPAIYSQLAAVQDESPVIELPFGIGDGLSSGIGSQDRRILYYATIHGHPLVGGYIGRMPPGAAAAYAAMPIVGNLLRLSSGLPAAEEPGASAVPFRYAVLDTATASPELVEYLHQSLDVDLIGTSNGRELYAVQGVKPGSLRASK